MSLKWRVECGEWKTLAAQREAAYDLLSRLVGETVNVEHDDKGAPHLPDYPDLNVNISHCPKAVAVAVSADGKVGIDVESRRRVGDDLMRRVCTPEELAAVHEAADPTMAFLQLWTRKEAVLKMRGTGIQGFGSMVAALADNDIMVKDLPTGNLDIVAAMAVSR